MNIAEKVVYTIVTILVLAIILMIGGCVYNDSQMTPEERAASSAQLQQEIDEDIKNKTYHYEVVNVSRYVQNHTNLYGGVIGRDIVTSFMYITSDGTIKVDDYYCGEIILSDKDEYVVCKSPYNQYKQLYLTKETMTKIQIGDAQ